MRASLLLPAITLTMQMIFDREFGVMPSSIDEMNQIYDNAYFDGGFTPEEVAQMEADFRASNELPNANDLPF